MHVKRRARALTSLIAIGIPARRPPARAREYPGLFPTASREESFVLSALLSRRRSRTRRRRKERREFVCRVMHRGWIALAKLFLSLQSLPTYASRGRRFSLLIARPRFLLKKIILFVLVKVADLPN